MRIAVTLTTETVRVVAEVVDADNAACALVEVLRRHEAHFTARPFAHLCGQAGPVDAMQERHDRDARAADGLPFARRNLSAPDLLETKEGVQHG